ncbi:uncharacterized protein K460DRAFT_363379 [Cucurbitaria berberidis CBS 394.84]|uniref:F-box domain-containing protein n=1 Tax=Cucurbitaria berberidis CBS 394.84 TaxID=1168544 RepID=A0A9P4GLK7_9PLEO|nr:uncharacterized protein K460DRAFT_363379 [Cucurbitaria berberidis CBS 394.84]KAF1847285.1 hypothetical protein K460DRAFT_363379 [Cucurbitaria berberidis CBS 394.84]
MTEVAPGTTYFSLPTELRLEIAAYALEQSPDTGLIGKTNQRVPPRRPWIRGLCLCRNYKAAPNLTIRLVCRQFRDDFTSLAFQKTMFTLALDPDEVIADQSDELLRNVRKLSIQCDCALITSWREFPFNRECMKLDELTIGMRDSPNGTELVTLLRRLKNVRVLRFILHRELTWMHLSAYNSLFGAILKEDHYQRYDAPNAPNVEATWWQCTFNRRQKSFTLVAQTPKPVMNEGDYMLLMKPLVYQVMKNAEYIFYLYEN